MRDQLTNLTSTTAATLAENLDAANTRALDAVIDANRKLVEFAVTTADRVAEQISFELPFADRLPALPTPAESGQRYLDFVERAVAVNREFNDRIVAMLKSDTTTVDTLVAKVTKAADATTDTVTGHATDAVAAVRSSAKQTAKKATARTATARKAATTRATAAKRSATKAAPTVKRTAKKAAAKASAAAE